MNIEHVYEVVVPSSTTVGDFVSANTLLTRRRPGWGISSAQHTWAAIFGGFTAMMVPFISLRHIMRAH